MAEGDAALEDVGVVAAVVPGGVGLVKPQRSVSSVTKSW